MTETRIIDGRDMQPPEPLEHAVSALEELADDAELVMLLYCQPFPLYDILRQEGYRWEEKLLEDGTREIRIRRGITK